MYVMASRSAQVASACLMTAGKRFVNQSWTQPRSVSGPATGRAQHIDERIVILYCTYNKWSLTCQSPFRRTCDDRTYGSSRASVEHRRRYEWETWYPQHAAAAADVPHFSHAFKAMLKATRRCLCSRIRHSTVRLGFRNTRKVK